MTASEAIAAVQSRVAVIESRLGLTPSTGDAAFRATLDQYRGPSLSTDATGGSTGAWLRTGTGGASGQSVVESARQFLGVPYVWGGTDPSGFDCSGLVQYVYRQAGVELPRVSADQGRVGSPVGSLAEAQPGDLLFWDTGPRNQGADHVAIYAGNGMMIEAPGRGGRVQLVPVSEPPDQIRRILGSTASDASGAMTGAGGAGLHGVPYADLFQRAGAAHGVDPALLAAIASVESGFSPTAVSHAGAQGLMQLMPGTAQGLGVADAFDPAQAVDGAARLLAGHLRRFGSVELALAAYNAGPGAVQRHGGIPPYAETQAYVPKVLARFQEYRA